MGEQYWPHRSRPAAARRRLARQTGRTVARMLARTARVSGPLAGACGGVPAGQRPAGPGAGFRG